MQSRDLIKKLEKLAPPEYAESWDNPGLLVGSADREVHKVYIALDADGGAVEKAVQCGCDMILTHHPLLFSAVKSILFTTVLLPYFFVIPFKTTLLICFRSFQPLF